MLSLGAPKRGSRTSSGDPVDGPVRRRSKRPLTRRPETSTVIHSDKQHFRVNKSFVKLYCANFWIPLVVK